MTIYTKNSNNSGGWYRHFNFFLIEALLILMLIITVIVTLPFISMNGRRCGASLLAPRILGILQTSLINGMSFRSGIFLLIMNLWVVRNVCLISVSGKSRFALS